MFGCDVSLDVDTLQTHNLIKQVDNLYAYGMICC